MERIDQLESTVGNLKRCLQEVAAGRQLLDEARARRRTSKTEKWIRNHDLEPFVRMDLHLRSGNDVESKSTARPGGGHLPMPPEDPQPTGERRAEITCVKNLPERKPSTPRNVIWQLDPDGCGSLGQSFWPKTPNSARRP